MTFFFEKAHLLNRVKISSCSGVFDWTESTKENILTSFFTGFSFSSATFFSTELTFISALAIVGLSAEEIRAH